MSDEETSILDVESVAVGGDGVAREESGRVVFVPRTAPGDRVEVRLREERASWARGEAVRLVEPGPGRREAPCPYYPGCGGCQLQHLTREAQLDAKRRIVRDALVRIGGLSPEVEPVRDPGPRFGYRNRVTLTLRRSDDGVRAGYHRHDDASRLVDVERCPLAEPPLNEAWTQLRESWGAEARHLPAGDELRITLRCALDGTTGLLVKGGDPEDPGRPDRITAALDGLSGYLWIPEGGERRLLAGESMLEDRWEGRRIRSDLGSFLQVNRRVAAAMERHLDALVGDPSGLRILDLYAGVGLRAMRWAERGARVEPCESDARAVEAGRRAAGEGADVTFHHATVEEALPGLLPADEVVVNPPRTGLSEEVTDVLRGTRPGRLTYVSCDPATLARDLKRLGDGWRLRPVQPFDVFPQTAHVEAVVRLEAE